MNLINWTRRLALWSAIVGASSMPGAAAPSPCPLPPKPGERVQWSRLSLMAEEKVQWSRLSLMAEEKVP